MMTKAKTNVISFLCMGIAFLLVFSSCSFTERIRKRPCTPEEDMRHHLNAGTKDYENGRYDKAEHELMRVLEYNPRDRDARYMLGVIYRRQGQIEKGRSEFAEVIGIDENYAKAYYNLGALYANEGPFRDVEKASILFRRYLELDQTSMYREKIERWLEKYGSQGNAIQKLNQGRTSEQPENKDFKEWLKEQSEKMNE
jgi:tetratricopeptide (TPR) repeat protein